MPGDFSKPYAFTPQNIPWVCSVWQALSSALAQADESKPPPAWPAGAQSWIPPIHPLLPEKMAIIQAEEIPGEERLIN